MIKLPDSSLQMSLPIDGLRFERNAWETFESPGGWFTTKLVSSKGPLISDFVTHEQKFKYGTYGIHIGQDDRLTFMGHYNRPIVGSFVDCRINSPTLRQRVDLTFAPMLSRKLVIPRGVAHTFDGLEGVVTRDEPVWYASENNPDWNFDNDLVSVDRAADLESFPQVRPNEHRLPDALHVFQSRLSQSLLQTPRSYLARYPVTIAGEQKYVLFRASRWGENEEQEVSRLTDIDKAPGMTIVRARYALTGPRSWTVVPSTDACVADVLVLSAATSPVHTKALHCRTRMWYTFLNKEGARLEVSVRDCRRDSPTFGDAHSIQTICDPRISFVVEPGIAYSFVCPEEVLVRAEQDVFVDLKEPRNDLPLFGQDVAYVDDAEPFEVDNLPQLRCPADVVRLLATNETNRLFDRDVSFQSH